MNASYNVDLWGSIRRGVTESANTAQATAAQLENARLLFQSELAQDYFQLRGVDGDIALLEETVTVLPGAARPHPQPLRRRHRLR